MPSQFAIITTIGDEFPSHDLPSGPIHIGGGPIYGGGHPSTGPIYGGGYPSGQPLPGGGHISLLPVYPFDPTVTPPIAPTDPTYPTPGPIHPGMKLVVKWLCGQGLIAVPEPKA